MSKKELSKIYQFSNVESKWYDKWENSQSFKPIDDKETFTIR